MVLGIASAMVTFLISVFFHYLLASGARERKQAKSEVPGSIVEGSFGLQVFRRPTTEP